METENDINTKTSTNNTSENNVEVKTSAEGKNIAVIAYITLIGLIVAFVMNNEKKDAFASYHIKQMLGLSLTGLMLGVIGMIPFLGWLINIIGAFILLYMWVMGLMKAINGKQKPVPILGEQYEEWFKNL